MKFVKANEILLSEIDKKLENWPDFRYRQQKFLGVFEQRNASYYDYLELAAFDMVMELMVLILHDNRLLFGDIVHSNGYRSPSMLYLIDCFCVLINADEVERDSRRVVPLGVRYFVTHALLLFRRYYEKRFPLYRAVHPHNGHQNNYYYGPRL